MIDKTILALSGFNALFNLLVVLHTYDMASMSAAMGWAVAAIGAHRMLMRDSIR
jgi:hypothetical protein